MNLYKINCGTYSQQYYVVAGSYAEAVDLWVDKYGSAPKGIELVTPYVIVSTDQPVDN